MIGMMFIEVKCQNEHPSKTTSVSFFDILESNSGFKDHLYYTFDTCANHNIKPIDRDETSLKLGSASYFDFRLQFSR